MSGCSTINQPARPSPVLPIEVSANGLAQGRYRIREVDLKCWTPENQNGAAVLNTAGFDGTSIRFDVCPTCQGDLNDDGAINTPDLPKFLGQFGTGFNVCLTGDFDGSGDVNTADLTIFLGRFGQPCSSPCGSSVMAPPGGAGGAGVTRGHAQQVGADPFAMAQAPTPPGPVIAALGFASAEAYDASLLTWSDDEVRLHIILVMDVIERLGLD